MPSPRLADLVPLDGSVRITALTGAGLSASAGLGTFRGKGGLWTASPDLQEALHADYLPDNVPLLWDVWGGLRHRATTAGPTEGHRALARAGATIVTQNVDGLHQDAGSTEVHEVHGSSARARCLDWSCGWHGESAYRPDNTRPRCPTCGGPARPDLVLFGESLDPDVWMAAGRAATTCDVLLVVGTSAMVTPAKWLVPMAREAGATCINVNLDPTRPIPDPFHAHLIGPADTILPAWAP